MAERLGKLDIVFVVDNTGSMGPYIEAVKRKILEIIMTIKKEELCRQLRLGLVMYRDFPPEEETFAVRKMELTTDTETIKKGVMSMEAQGGGDGPEAVPTALNVARRMEFLREAAKVVVLIGDAPPHGVEPNDTYKAGWPDGVLWEEEAAKMYEDGIVVHTVGCYPEIASYKRAEEVFKAIAEKTGGDFFRLAEADNLVALITGIAMEEIDKIAIQKAILAELGEASVAELEAMSDAEVEALADRLREMGVRKREVHLTGPPGEHPPAHRDFMMAGSAPEPERIVMAEKAVAVEDVMEAVRQLKRKLEDEE